MTLSITFSPTQENYFYEITLVLTFPRIYNFAASLSKEVIKSEFRAAS